MTTCGVTAVCFLTIAACITGILADDKPAYKCGINYCTKCEESTSTCVECDKYAGYTINQATNACELICPYIGGCILCATRDNGDHVCKQCMNCWGVDNNGQCIQCSTFANCSRCSNTSVCEMCDTTNNMGPKRDGLSADCGPCGGNCNRCYVSGAGLCDQCTSGSPEPFEGICECASNCETCSQQGWAGCDKCRSGYGLADSGNWKMKCQKCPENCVSCDHLGSGQCGTCANGYGLGNDFTCKNCQTENICSGNGNCRSTRTGFLCTCTPDYTGLQCESHI